MSEQRPNDPARPASGRPRPAVHRPAAPAKPARADAPSPARQNAVPPIAPPPPPVTPPPPPSIAEATPRPPENLAAPNTALTGPTDFFGSVIAPMQILIGVISGVLLAVILISLDHGLWPVAIVVFLAAIATGVYLAPLSLTVADARITIGQGRREKEPTVIYVAEVRDAGLREMSLVQCLGLANVESDDRTTRLAVRPGTTLVLTLHNGERYLVSVTDGPAALRALGRN